MECRVIHRAASRHHHNRIREADLAGVRGTIHAFYQLQEAPAGETGVTYTHSSLEPPSRHDGKNAWTRSDSKAVRRHEEERMRPEHTLTKFMATSLIWIQEVSPVIQQDVQEGRIKRYLRHDIAIEMGIDAADAMYYQLTMWPGRGYQWAVKIPTRLREAYTAIGFIILPKFHIYPETRLDVYDFITKPISPVSAHITGHYPPFSQERLNLLKNAGDRWAAGNTFEASGLIVDRAQGKMQGWFRMPHDSIAGRWWCLINSQRRIPEDARIADWMRVADEVGELQKEPWVEEHEDFWVAHPDEADAS